MLQKEVVEHLCERDRRHIKFVHALSVRDSKGYLKLNTTVDGEVWRLVENERSTCPKILA